MNYNNKIETQFDFWLDQINFFLRRFVLEPIHRGYDTF